MNVCIDKRQQAGESNLDSFSTTTVLFHFILHPKGLLRQVAKKREPYIFDDYAIKVDRAELLVGSQHHKTLSKNIKHQLSTFAASIQLAPDQVKPFLYHHRKDLVKLNAEIETLAAIKIQKRYLKELNRFAEINPLKISTCRHRIKQLSRNLHQLDYPKITDALESNIISNNLPIENVSVKDIQKKYNLRGDYLLLKNNQPIVCIELKRTFRTLTDSIAQGYQDILDQATDCVGKNIKFVIIICRVDDDQVWQDVYFSRNALWLDDYKRFRNRIKKDFPEISFVELKFQRAVYAGIKKDGGNDNIHLQLRIIANRILQIACRRIDRDVNEG